MDSNHRYLERLSYRFDTDFCRLRDGSFLNGIHFFRDGEPSTAHRAWDEKRMGSAVSPCVGQIAKVPPHREPRSGGQ
jgi:hypothetical protein